MGLKPGTTLGQFEILESIGAGGMGEVFRARDSKLGRDVAVKILPEIFALDEERLGRFQREARLLASLNHPNIATIHDYAHDETEGVHYLVMELIEGDTLGDRIERGAIHYEQALPIFAQIAEALETAHEQGVIHRDLKPANIKVSDDGNVKVLDFGLGKMIETKSEPPSAASPTRAATPDSTKMSKEGIVLGTPVYMSPEQARGKPVDKRTDIWAFGCCLYEALTGQLPFHGETVSDTLAKVLEREPDWELLPKDIPWRVRDLLENCLEKDARYRLRDIGDAWATLRRLITESGRIKAVEDRAAATSKPFYTLAGGMVVAALIIAGALLFMSKNGQSPAAPAPQFDAPEPELKPLRRFSINLDPSLPLIAAGFRFQLAVSPDEGLLVYTSGDPPETFLVKRRLDQLEGEPMPGTEGAVDPFFSPNGQWIGFWDQRNNKLKKVSVRGGSPVTLCDTERSAGGGFWGADGYILFGAIRKGVLRVPDAGGIPEEVTALEEGELEHSAARALPGSKTILYTSFKGPFIEGLSIMAYSYETQESRKLLDGAGNAQFLPTGHLVYAAPGGLMARPFDPEAVAFTGPAVPVGEAEMAILPSLDLPMGYAISPGGSLLYARDADFSQRAGAPRSLVWVDRSGVETPVNDSPKQYEGPRVSPDGGMIAYGIREAELTQHIWVYDLARDSQTLLTYDPMPDMGPVWTPDGRHVDFLSFRDGTLTVYRKAADGTGAAERLIARSRFRNLVPRDWTADSQSLILTVGPIGERDLFIFSPESDEEPRNLLETPFDEMHPRISPDGRWIAYSSDSSNRREVYVRAFPSMEGRWQVSTDGGDSPLWSPDGSELFFRNGEAVLVVSVETETTFTRGLPEVLFEGPYVPGNYDLAPDGERFLMLKPLEEAEDEEAVRGVTEIVIVQNWVDHIKRLVPVPNAN